MMTHTIRSGTGDVVALFAEVVAALLASQVPPHRIAAAAMAASVTALHACRMAGDVDFDQAVEALVEAMRQRAAEIKAEARKGAH